jgi:predicted DNA-binding ribbon-helix-helix protein
MNSAIYPPRKVFLEDYRTTVRLEPVMWEALEDIARHRGTTRQDVIKQIDLHRGRSEGLSSAIRVYIVKCYRRRCGELEAKR